MNGNHAERNGGPILSTGKLLIDIRHRLVRLADAPCRGLLNKEVNLLSLLASNPGKVFGGKGLLERVWGPELQEGYDAVDAVIKRIRKKIEPVMRHPRYLITVRGPGYCIGGRKSVVSVWIHCADQRKGRPSSLAHPGMRHRSRDLRKSKEKRLSPRQRGWQGRPQAC
jgi:DNA-binding winged helix-turn-helix (wHTH) protein